MSLAFPSLFPTGKGDYVQPREREISYSDYLLHLMRYSDGRFASHSRFPYFVFNTRMRQQSSQLSSFFVNRFNRPEGRDVSIDDISAASAADSGDYHAQALLNSVVRSGASLRGTRPFWNGKKHQLMSYIRSLGKPSVTVLVAVVALRPVGSFPFGLGRSLGLGQGIYTRPPSLVSPYSLFFFTTFSS